MWDSSTVQFFRDLGAIRLRERSGYMAGVHGISGSIAMALTHGSWDAKVYI